MNQPNQHPGTEFIEGLGLATEADGLPRIAGRILGLLIVEEGPFRFDEIAECLQISRASVSTNTRLLESMGIIERFTQPGERRDFFRLGEDPFGRMLSKSLDRLRHLHRLTDDCLKALPQKQAGEHGRLRTMRRFYELALTSTERALEDWRLQNQSEERTPAS